MNRNQATLEIVEQKIVIVGIEPTIGVFVFVATNCVNCVVHFAEKIMKILNAKIHGILDYVVVVFLLLSPSVFLFSGFVSTFTYVLGLVHLTLTLITNFPMGLVKILPLKIHGLIELIVSFALIILCFALKLKGVDFYFYLAFGAAVFTTWTLTNYE